MTTVPAGTFMTLFTVTTMDGTGASAVWFLAVLCKAGLRLRFAQPEPNRQPRRRRSMCPAGLPRSRGYSMTVQASSGMAVPRNRRKGGGFDLAGAAAGQYRESAVARRRLLVNPDWAGQSHRRRLHEQRHPEEGSAMYIGIGTVVLIVIIVLVILMLRRR